jgi:hypothetical protein
MAWSLTRRQDGSARWLGRPPWWRTRRSWCGSRLTGRQTRALAPKHGLLSAARSEPEGTTAGTSVLPGPTGSSTTWISSSQTGSSQNVLLRPIWLRLRRQGLTWFAETSWDGGPGILWGRLWGP